MRTKSDIKTIFIAALTMMLLLAPVEVYGVSSKQAQYDGGTITQIRKSETGTLITGDTDLRFEYKQSSFAIPYSSITDMEYGDKLFAGIDVRRNSLVAFVRLAVCW